MPEFYGALVEALARADAVDEALQAISDGLAVVQRTGERWYEANFYIMRANLRKRRNDADANSLTEDYFRAIEIAQSQQAKSWELRAATSLALLWQSQGKARDAHDLLAPVYDWFTEGFDTADLKDAKALLEELK